MKEANYYKQRRHLLYFQCVVEPNFDNVVKSKFYDIENRTLGERMVSAPQQASTLFMMGSMPPPPSD